jgi:hypothetical protein
MVDDPRRGVVDEREEGGEERWFGAGLGGGSGGRRDGGRVGQ